MDVRVKIVRHNAEFHAWSPDLPGCTSCATTSEEAERGILAAVDGYVASLHAATSVRVQVHHQEQDCLPAGAR